MEQFRNYDINNTSFFTLDGKKLWARVVDILDGDSIVVVFPIFGNYYKWSVRLSGIDTCEKTSKTPEVRDIALAAKRELFQLITNQELQGYSKQEIKDNLCQQVFIVWLHCLEFDKFGRLLANVSKAETSELFSDVLVKKKLAYVYHGEKKLTEQEQLLLLRGST